MQADMITRRTLLLGTASLAVGSTLTGCSHNADALRMTLLEGAIPPEVIKKFRQQTSESVRLQTLTQMHRAFQQLQSWQHSPEDTAALWRRLTPWRQDQTLPLADSLVSLGDYWLTEAIAQNLIEPISLSEEAWEHLPVQWQQFVNRDSQGQVAGQTPDQNSAELQRWAAPYKIQALTIVYRQSLTSGQTGSALPYQTWQDLFSAPLKQRIALPSHPNLVLGLLQKIQSGRFNSSFDSVVNSSASIPQLTEQLTEQFTESFQQVNQQVRAYDSSTALKALINGDVQVAVAWSGDVVTALQRYRDLRAAIPADGTLLSADMWVQPKGTDLSAAAKQWIDFCWQSGPATQISVSGRGISPVFLSDPVALPEVLSGNFIATAALQKSEPLLPLPDNLQSAYFSVWQQLRSS
ncbi:MAG: extracellular solute-binding protein [Cyanobacteria bacterium J06627_32]